MTCIVLISTTLPPPWHPCDAKGPPDMHVTLRATTCLARHSQQAACAQVTLQSSTMKDPAPEQPGQDCHLPSLGAWQGALDKAGSCETEGAVAL